MPKQNRLGGVGIILLCLFVILFSYFFFFRKENFKLKSGTPVKVIAMGGTGNTSRIGSRFGGPPVECADRILNSIQGVASTALLVLAAPVSGGATLIPAAGAAYVTARGIEETKKAGC